MKRQIIYNDVIVVPTLNVGTSSIKYDNYADFDRVKADILKLKEICLSICKVIFRIHILTTPALGSLGGSPTTKMVR
jgi:hypothetical protein